MTVVDPLLLLICYKLALLAVGTVFAILGYKLFARGVLATDTDFQAIWKDMKILVRRAAAGVLFALFGAVIIVISIAKGINVDRQPITPGEQDIVMKAAGGDTLTESERRILQRTLRDHGFDVQHIEALVHGHSNLPWGADSVLHHQGPVIG